MIVHVPTPLLSYTGDEARVEVGGHTLDEVLSALDRRYPGLRFRIIDEAQRVRRHIKLFVGTNVTEDLTVSVTDADEVHIICALSGG